MASATSPRAPSRSRDPCRQPAGDQHQHVRSQGGRLLDRAPVVVDARGAGLVGRREEPAAAQGGDAQARVADGRAAAAAAAGLGDLVAPQADPPDARPARSPRRPRRRSSALVVIWLRLSRVRCVTPPPRPPRSTARSAVGGELAVGEQARPGRRSTNARARCATERALSSPPTIRKCVLVAGQPGQEDDAGLVVPRSAPRRGGGRAATVGARISSKRVGVTGVQRGQRGRGGRRDRVEDAEQRVAVALAVAADQLRVVEVVAGVEPHAVGQPARAASTSRSASSSETLMPSILAACARDDRQAASRSPRPDRRSPSSRPAPGRTSARASAGSPARRRCASRWP